MLVATAIFLAPIVAPLTSTPPISVPGGAGKYDFTNIDVENRMFLACHPGRKSITVVNLKNQSVTDVDLGTECNGSSPDPVGHMVYAAGPGNTLVSLDTKTWKVTGKLALSGPGDSVQVDRKHGVVYVANDDGTNLWVVNLKTLKLTQSITIKEAPEYTELDLDKDRIYQPIKSSSTVQVIDAKSLKIVKEWTLGALTGPHGFAIDRKTQTAMVVGSNGQLTLLNATTGQILSEMAVLPKSDQIAYDAELHRLYIPAGGKLQVISVAGGKGTDLGTVPVDRDCKRVSVDTATHDVWVAFSNTTGSFVQRFKPTR